MGPRWLEEVYIKAGWKRLHASLPWYAMKLLVIGALPAAYSGTHAYFLLDQIELAHDLVTGPS